MRLPSRRMVTRALSFRACPESRSAGRGTKRGIGFPSARLAVLTLGVWLLAASLPVILLAQPPQVDKEAFRRISDKLICQCGCNYGLSHCPHLQCPSAPVLRASIRRNLAAGLADQEILDAMVADNGLAVLAAPPAEGFNLTAWVMPFAVFLLGLMAVLIIAFVWRFVRRPAPAADPALLERYRKRIEREMKHLEE